MTKLIEKVRKLLSKQSQKSDNKVGLFFYVENNTPVAQVQWKPGQEIEIAELIYLVNNGVYLDNLLGIIEKTGQEFGQEDSAQQVLQHLQGCYQAQEELLQQMSEPEDAPVIKPSDVFGKAGHGQINPNSGFTSDS